MLPSERWVASCKFLHYDFKLTLIPPRTCTTTSRTCIPTRQSGSWATRYVHCMSNETNGLMDPAWRITCRSCRTIIWRTGPHSRGTRRSTTRIPTTPTPTTWNAGGNDGNHPCLPYCRSHSHGRLHWHILWLLRCRIRHGELVPYRSNHPL